MTKKFSLSHLSACFIIAFVVALSSGTAKAQTCIVFDPADTGVNIRAMPNGTLINRLRNGRLVTINEIGFDTKGRPWARVAGYYDGRWRYWGWAFMDLLRCR
jgi:hypothetical protein